MAESGTIFILNPRSTIAYGQDFLDALLRHEPGFTPLDKENGVYPIHLISDAKAVVGQNPDDPEESRVLNDLGNTWTTAVFVHCQWEYYSEKQKQNVAHALETATIGLTPARFVSDRMQERFRKVRWKTVDGCVDTEFFYPSIRSERREFRSRIGLAEDDKAVLFTGRLEPAKGTKILEDLCASSRREFAILVQYPAWEEVREKEALFQSYLDICRRVSAFPDVYPLPDDSPRFDPRSDPKPVRFADVFVSTSLSEVQPLVLLEALASGVPYVGTNSTPGYAELQHRFRDSATLSGAIETIDLPHNFYQGAFPRFTKSDFDYQTIADQLVEAINRKAVPDDSARAALSTEFLDRGFTVPVRTLKFRQALEETSPEDVLV